MMWIVRPAVALAALFGVLMAPIETWLKFAALAGAAAWAAVVIGYDKPGGGPPCCGG